VGGLTDVVGSPEFATGVGLLLYGLEKQKIGFEGKTKITEGSGPIKGFASSVRNFFREAF